MGRRWWLLLCVCVAACASAACGLSLEATFTLQEEQEWLSWALRRQVAVQQGVSLDRVVFPTTSLSFNSRQDGYFNETHLQASGQVLYSQEYSLARQAALGVRRLEIEAHWVFASLRVCHGSEAVRDMCETFAASTGIPDGCARVLNVPLVGEHTGCRDTDPTVQDTLETLAAIMRTHSDELFVLRLVDNSEGRTGSLDALLQATFGDLLYKPADKTTDAWPTLATLLAGGSRLVVETSAKTPSSAMFAAFSSPTAPFNYAGAFLKTPVCGYTSGAAVDARLLPFAAFLEDRRTVNLCTLVSGHSDATVSVLAPSVCGGNFKPEYEFIGSEVTGTLSSETVGDIVACGLTPSFGLVTPDRLRAVVWSWKQGAGLSPVNRGAVMTAASDGRWFQDDLSSQRHVACKALDTSLSSLERWHLTEAGSTAAADATSACPPGFAFQPPSSHEENAALLQAMRRTATVSAWLNDFTHPGASAASPLACFAPVLLLSIVAAAVAALV